jgi:hypothetical protein
MDSVDHIERRARIRYEVARLRRALLGFAPVLVLVAVAAVFAKRPSSTVAFGVATFAVGVVLLWYGRDLKRAVLPGLAAGIAPLVLVLCANHVGHMCMGDNCTMLCIPACAVGGIVAGLAVAAVGVQQRSGTGFWVAASSIALLTGSMGCACVGYAGLAGLALGLAAGLVPGLVRKLAGGRAG